jgi:hypothetical protein
MKSLNDFFEDGELTNLLRNNIDDPWHGTKFQGYVNLTNRKKGIFGEKLVSKIMISRYRSEVISANNYGHDRIIDGYKTEIKFSLSLNENRFMFNHISCNKDWERLILLGVNYNNFQMNWIHKKDFIENTGIFSRQQGGKKVENDDFMFSGNYKTLLASGILQSMNDWFNGGKKRIGLENHYG